MLRMKSLIKSFLSSPHGPVLLVTSVFVIDTLQINAVASQVLLNEVLESISHISLNQDTLSLFTLVVDFTGSCSSSKSLGHYFSCLRKINAPLVQAPYACHHLLASSALLNNLDLFVD